MSFRKTLLALSLAVALCFTGCASQSGSTAPATPVVSQSNLTKIASSLKTVADTIGLLQTAVLQANAAGQISDADVYKIKAVTDRINLAGKETVSLTRNYAQLSNTDQATLKGLYQPLLTAVDDSISTGLAGIKNPATQSKVHGYLAIIRTSVASVLALLGA